MRIKKNDLFIGIYIMCAILFFIISIPSGLLDVLLAFNIAVAFIILFNALYAKEVLDMASFPTILLFTTLFRISLNVSSTKLILTNGDAGKVVETFGEFVGGGNLVIGIIIFIILIIVQFVVINKGSERVAEVTARFTLDAMAGKQMAIDSDLNTGAITDKEAAERRKKLQQENSFFGTILNADVSTELLLTIFHINTPLHDGAVVINGSKIISAGVLLPLTDDPKLSWKYGTRHRAAIGMTESSNAACLVVSEETGDVSVTMDGTLKKYDDIPTLKADLENILGYKKTEDEVKKPIFNLEKLITLKKNEK